MRQHPALLQASPAACWQPARTPPAARRSWGPICWLYPTEIQPLETRAAGASLNTASNMVRWAPNAASTPALHSCGACV